MKDLEKIIQEKEAEIAALKIKAEALDQSMIAFDIVDENGKFIYANHAYLKLWGYESLDEIIGTSPAEHCVDPETPIKIITTLKEKGSCNIEFKARRKDGTTFDVHMWANVTHDEDGRELYPTTSFDITDRKLAEEEIQFQSNLTKTVTDNAYSCLFIMDKFGHPTFMNPAAKKVTGYASLEEIRSKPLHHAIHYKKPDGSHYPMEECPIDNAQATLKHVQNQEEVFCTKEGILFPVSYSVSPLEKNGEVIGSVLEFSDITQQKKVYSDLKEAIRSRDEFLSIASHELKTPLTAMKLRTQLRLRQLESGMFEETSSEQLKQTLVDELKQINRISRLIEDMLDISRINSGQFTIRKTSFDLKELVCDVVTRNQQLHDDLSLKLDETLSDKVQIFADQLRMEQVLENLLSNAFRYGAGMPVEVELSRKGENVLISVKDQGSGIPAEDQNRIFNRFERAVSASEISGLGLGLNIVREIVLIHHGRIWLKSHPGQGSTFFVELPLKI